MLNLSAAALLSVVVAIFLGRALFHRRGANQGRRSSAAFSVVTSVFWLTAGIFAILGGLYVIGALVVAIMTYFALSNYAIATENGGLRARIAGSR